MKVNHRVSKLDPFSGLVCLNIDCFVRPEQGFKIYYTKSWFPTENHHDDAKHVNVISLSTILR